MCGSASETAATSNFSSTAFATMRAALSRGLLVVATAIVTLTLRQALDFGSIKEPSDRLLWDARHSHADALFHPVGDGVGEEGHGTNGGAAASGIAHRRERGLRYPGDGPSSLSPQPALAPIDVSYRRRVAAGVERIGDSDSSGGVAGAKPGAAPVVADARRSGPDTAASPVMAPPAASEPLRTHHRCHRMEPWADICVYDNLCFDGQLFYLLDPHGSAAAPEPGSYIWACTCVLALWPP